MQIFFINNLVEQKFWFIFDEPGVHLVIHLGVRGPLSFQATENYFLFVHSAVLQETAKGFATYFNSFICSLLFYVSSWLYVLGVFWKYHQQSNWILLSTKSCFCWRWYSGLLYCDFSFHYGILLQMIHSKIGLLKSLFTNCCKVSTFFYNIYYE